MSDLTHRLSTGCVGLTRAGRLRLSPWWRRTRRVGMGGRAWQVSSRAGLGQSWHLERSVTIGHAAALHAVGVELTGVPGRRRSSRRAVPGFRGSGAASCRCAVRRCAVGGQHRSSGRAGGRDVADAVRVPTGPGPFRRPGPALHPGGVCQKRLRCSLSSAICLFPPTFYVTKWRCLIFTATLPSPPPLRAAGNSVPEAGSARSEAPPCAPAGETLPGSVCLLLACACASSRPCPDHLFRLFPSAACYAA